MRSLLVPLAAVASGWALSATDAEATTLRTLNTGEMVGLADLIVRGTVAEVWTERDANGVIWTRAQVTVEHVYKGDPATDLLIVDQLGGSWAGLRSDVFSAARFSADEDVLLFIDQGERSGRNLSPGMMNGKYTIRLDPYSRAPIVQRFAPSADRPYDHRFIPLPPAGQRVPLADFEAQINGFVAAPVEVK